MTRARAVVVGRTPLALWLLLSSLLLLVAVLRGTLPESSSAPTHRFSGVLGRHLRTSSAYCSDQDERQASLPPRPFQCPPSFLLIGARKGGTTSMYMYLNAHPDMKGAAMNNGPSTGEVQYFDKPKRLQMGPRW